MGIVHWTVRSFFHEAVTAVGTPELGVSRDQPETSAYVHITVITVRCLR